MLVYQRVPDSNMDHPVNLYLSAYLSAVTILSDTMSPGPFMAMGSVAFLIIGLLGTLADFHGD